MKFIYEDLRMCDVEDMSFMSLFMTFLAHPEYRLVVYYRLYSHWSDKGPVKKAISKLFWLRAVKYSGCYISRIAKIGKGLRLPHATGIVIGDGARIGDNVTIYQNVTIGKKGEEDTYPIIGNNVTIYAGACVIGKIKLGDGAVVGANSVVLSDVPPKMIVAGAPAENVRNKKKETVLKRDKILHG